MYGYNPYNYASPYQQRLAQLEQPPLQVPQGPQNAPMLKGRVVASVEEAKAAQVDFDGSATYFVCPGEQKIYAKSIGLNGMPVFQIYKLCTDVEVKSNDDSLIKRLEMLERQVKELTNGHNVHLDTLVRVMPSCCAMDILPISQLALEQSQL